MIKGLENQLLKARPFRYLSLHDILFLIKFGSFINVKTGEKILTQGKQGAGLYIVISGKVSVVVNILVQRNFYLCKLSAGSFFGEVNLLSGEPCTTSIISKNAEIFLVDKKTFFALRIIKPSIYYNLCRALIEDVVTRQNEILLNIKKNIKKHNLRKPKVKFQKIKAHELPISVFKKEYLNLKIFSDLFSKKEMTALLKYVKFARFSDQTYIISKDNKHFYAYFLLSGGVKIQIENFNLAVVGPNSFFSSELLLHEKQKLEYISCGHIDALQIDIKNLFRLEQSDRQLWYKLFDLACLHFVSLQLKLNTLNVRVMSETK